MGPNSAPLEPTAVATALLTAVFGPALAGVIGPYAVIILASLVGGGWALSRRDSDKHSGAMFLLLITGTATLVTVAIATVANRWVNLESVTWLLAPIGLIIGAVGHDWTRVGSWVADRIGRRVDKTLDTSNPTPPPGGTP